MKLSFRFALIFAGVCACSSAFPASTPQGAEPQRESYSSSKLPRIYEHWLDEDVRYIATPQEREEFLRLSTNEDRDRFVEQFWKHRDPTPNTVENEFKEEHYRRLAYANEHFAAGVAGFKTDRGRTYIVYGPPDEIVRRPQVNSEHSIETWHYRVSTSNSGKDSDFKFVDECECNDYRLENPSQQLH